MTKHEIEFDRRGTNLVLTCSECGVFYNKKKSSTNYECNIVITQESNNHCKEKNHHGTA